MAWQQFTHFHHLQVSEDADSEYAQSMILAAIFTIMEKSLYLIREMNDLAGYVLLHRVLESSPSSLGFHIVKVKLIDFLKINDCNSDLVSWICF